MAINQNTVGYLTKLLQVLTNDVNAIGNETLVVDTIALSLTPTSGANKALIQVQSTVTTTAIRYWENGTVPTSSTGFSQGNGAVIELTTAENIKNFKIIKETAGTTQIVVTYYK